MKSIWKTGFSNPAKRWNNDLILARITLCSSCGLYYTTEQKGLNIGSLTANRYYTNNSFAPANHWNKNLILYILKTAKLGAGTSPFKASNRLEDGAVPAAVLTAQSHESYVGPYQRALYDRVVNYPQVNRLSETLR